MFKRLKIREKELTDTIGKLIKERDYLYDENSKLKVDNKQLSKKRTIEEESIAHKIKMREEGCEISFQKKEQKVLNESADKVRKVKDEYQVKVEKHLEKRNDELRSMYTEILARLPDVNVRLNAK